jgi:DNA polymerase-3 subunit delta
MFYIFHGDDTHSLKRTVVEFTSKLGEPSMLDLNTTRFDERVTFAELRQACDAIPFLSARRLVMVEDALSNAGWAVVDDLVDYLPHLPDTTLLFFLESQTLRQNHRLLTFAQKQENGYVKSFVRPEGRALEHWIRQQVTGAGGQIAPRAVHALAINVGNDLSILSNEIEKLLLYAGSEGTIDVDAVTLLCPYVAEASIFDLVDALGSRNGRTAASLLHQKLGEGTDPFYLFAMIVRQFRLLIQIKELAEEGQRPPAIAKSLKLHSFVVGKLYQQSNAFTLEQLERVYEHLLQVDVDVKTGRADMVTSLDLLVNALTV